MAFQPSGVLTPAPPDAGRRRRLTMSVADLVGELADIVARASAGGSSASNLGTEHPLHRRLVAHNKAVRRSCQDARRSHLRRGHDVS